MVFLQSSAEHSPELRGRMSVCAQGPEIPVTSSISEELCIRHCLRPHSKCHQMIVMVMIVKLTTIMGDRFNTLIFLILQMRKLKCSESWACLRRHF